MKVTVESTPKIVEINGVPARVWQDQTEGGIPVIAFLTRIAAERDQDLAEFEADLQEHAQPVFDVQQWPDRMLIDPARPDAEWSGDVFAEDLIAKLDGGP